MLSKFTVQEVPIFDRVIRFFDFGNQDSLHSIYIQGHLHSTEVNSFSTLCCLVEKLIDNHPSIRIRVVPTCNPFGWEIYLNGNDGRASLPGKMDWNRIFSTVPKKDSTIEKELANELWNLSHGFRQIIDVHTPDFGFPHVYTCEFDNRLLTFDDLPYAISDYTRDGSFQNLNYFEREISSFTLELPSYNIWTSLEQEYWADRIREEINANEQQLSRISTSQPQYWGKMVSLSSRISGVPLLLVKPNEVAKANSEIFKVTSVEGQNEIISFEKDCIPLCFRRRGLIQAGRMIVKVLSLYETA